MDTGNKTHHEADPGLPGLFAPHSYADWKAAADSLLKGVPLEKALMTPTYEGITLRPLYRLEDIRDLPHLGRLPGVGGSARGGRAGGYQETPWAISQELPYGTPEEFNEVARHDLGRGQTELNIPLDLATRAGQDPDTAEVGKVGACGLSLASLDDLDRALAGIDLKTVPLYFRAGSSGLPVAALLFSLARKRGLGLGVLRGCVEMDPLASLCWKGELSVSLGAAFREMALLAGYAAEHAPHLQTIGVQGHPYHDGGGSAVQELGYAVATAVAYAREMEHRGLPFALVAPRVRMSLSVGSHFFMEIAKFRAARLLWARVAELWGAGEEAARLHLHARTALWNKTRLDPAVNFLRGTTEAFSAVVGGCDSLHVGPYDEVVRVPDSFSRRVARNTQVILQEECDLTRVIDPAGGAYYVEWLTHEVAQRAWQVFQEVEAAGGMILALEQGIPQAAVAKVREVRLANLARRKDVLVGTNQYPNGKEKPLDPRPLDYAQIRQRRARQVEVFRTAPGNVANTAVIERLSFLLEAPEESVVEGAVRAVESGATIGEMSRTLRSRFPGRAKAPTIPQSRASEPHERLRQASESHRAAHGHAPRVLQVNYGPSRQYRIRADWTTAFFEVAGMEVLADRDFKDAGEAAEALRQSGAPVAILTSTDETYASAVPEVAQALRTACPGVMILVAGAPGEQEAAWKAAGVDDFIHLRVNNYSFLEGLLKRIGAL